MKWKTHQAIAVSCWTFTFNGTLESIIGLFVVWVTSTIPDIDSKLGMRHRAFTHSLIALVVISALGYALYKPLLVHILIGYGSHLIADSFTKTGIQLFYPYRKMFGAKMISTGSSAEYMILLACMAYLLTKWNG